MTPADWGALSEEDILCRLSEVPVVAPPHMDGFRSAAVLVPLIYDTGGWQLLFTRRTETVQSHKGQVSFPGGGAEPGDLSPEDTALREAYEEIGLASHDVTLFKRLPYMKTISNFVITPVLARIRWPYTFLLSQEEVTRVFTIPLAWLANGKNWEERPYRRSNGKVENVIFYRLYDGETLWGITARITVDLLAVLSK